MRRATASLKRVRGCSLDWESWCEVQRGDYKIQGWQSKDATLNGQEQVPGPSLDTGLAVAGRRPRPRFKVK